MNAGANEFLIAGNGAFVYDMQKKEIIYKNYIEKQKILEIIKICEENSIFYNIYTPNEVITKTLAWDSLFYNNENKKNPPDKKININITENIYDYVQNYKKDDFLKITICDNDKSIFRGIMNKLRKIRNIDVLDVGHMSRKLIKSGTEEIEIAYFYTEITNKNVNKWTAVESLIKILGISKEEVMGIGDNVNDKELIEEAGMGIAMGQSAPKVKEIADDAVSDNDNSGVAEAIQKYILQ